MKRSERSREFSPRRFRLAVIARDLYTRQVAKYLGVCQFTVFAWLSLRNDPPVDTVRKMEKFLKLPAGFLEGVGSLDVLEDDRAPA